MIISEKSDEAANFIGFSAFHTFGIVPVSITPPSLQCLMLPGVNQIGCPAFIGSTGIEKEVFHNLNLTAFHKGFNSWVRKQGFEKTHGGNAVEIALEAVTSELR